MEERKLYTITVPMTQGEARALLATAGRRGQTLGAFIGSLAGDLLSEGDESDMLYDYLERSEPDGAGRSFVAFCLSNHVPVDTLDESNQDIKHHKRELAVIRAAIDKGMFPEDDGWEPGTTPEDAQKELAFHEKALKEAKASREWVLTEYANWASYYEETMMEEEEALEEAKAYREEEAAILFPDDEQMELEVEVCEAPDRETYLALQAVANDPSWQKLARKERDVNKAADILREKALKEMPSVRGLYRALLLNALDAVSFFSLVRELRSRE